MKRRDLIRHLEHHGCEFLREGGNHTVYVNPRQLPLLPATKRPLLEAMKHKRPKSPSHSIEWLARELSGQVDLGARNEVRRLTRLVIHHVDLDAEVLSEVVRAIGVLNNSHRWRREMELAYARLAKKEQHRARAAMMSYYYTIEEMDLALSFCSPRDLRDPRQVMFAMDIYLHFGKLAEARKVAKKGKILLARSQTAFDASLLIEALACYHARRREWDVALALWSDAPRSQPLAGNAAVGTVEVFIAGALDVIMRELQTIGAFLKQPPSELELSLPGIEEELLRDTEKALLRLKRGLERLVPEQRRQALGLI